MFIFLFTNCLVTVQLKDEKDFRIYKIESSCSLESYYKYTLDLQGHACLNFNLDYAWSW